MGHPHLQICQIISGDFYFLLAGVNAQAKNQAKNGDSGLEDQGGQGGLGQAYGEDSAQDSWLENIEEHTEDRDYATGRGSWCKGKDHGHPCTTWVNF